MDNIAHTIRRVREERNYTQEYMASQLGISTKSYSNLENNIHRLTLDRLHHIAEVLEVPLIRLLEAPDLAMQRHEKQLQQLQQEIRELKQWLINKEI
jgi:transcriptional regulator with XRE-family HTH domain